jgi:asparagine synthase (glutamine-hydrolysing)
MCGICGIVNFDGRPIEPEVIGAMTASLVHRGPDGEGLYCNSTGGAQQGPVVALGHRRLAVIDLSPNGKQPMTNEDGSLWIVFNGEIYNFRELRARLQAQGHVFRSSSDTEVILRLYEEVGEKCLEEMDGMFAFALWDGRKKQLFLARDRVGKKPLYYAQVGSTFVFGSEVKALLRNPAISGELSVEALPSYFTFGYPPSDQSFFKGLRQLEPAHAMTVGPEGRSEVWRYWDLDFFPAPGRIPSFTEATDQVRSLVTEAVRKRLVSDVPIGAFLSGGIDSSIVVGLMSRLMDRPVKTFSIGFTGDPDFDETRYARIVADHFRTEHTEFIVEPKAINLIETLVWQHDGPFGDPSTVPTFILSQLTRQHVTVALNGDGGDELFAGYLRFHASVAAERLPSGLSRLANRALMMLPEPKQYHHWLRRAQRFFSVASEPLFVRLHHWTAFFDRDLSELLRPEVIEGLRVVETVYPRRLLDRTSRFSTLSKVLYVNFMTYLPEDLLVKADRSTMAHGLEGRSPFLDHRLAEYAAALPDQYKFRRGTTKYVLRTAFADLLPAEILRRGKRGFGVPLGAWFRGELRDYVQDLLLSPSALSREYLEPSFVARTVREHVEGDRDHGNRLWLLLTFEVWLRMMRDQATLGHHALGRPAFA